MGLLSVKQYNKMQDERKASFLEKLDSNGLSETDINRMCNRYFPKINLTYGYVSFDDKTCCTEIKHYRKKPY